MSSEKHFQWFCCCSSAKFSLLSLQVSYYLDNGPTRWILQFSSLLCFALGHFFNSDFWLCCKLFHFCYHVSNFQKLLFVFLKNIPFPNSIWFLFNGCKFFSYLSEDMNDYFLEVFLFLSIYVLSLTFFSLFWALTCYKASSNILNLLVSEMEEPLQENQSASSEHTGRLICPALYRMSCLGWFIGVFLGLFSFSRKMLPALEKSLELPDSPQSINSGYRFHPPGGSSSRTFSSALPRTHTLYSSSLTSPSFWGSPLPFAIVGSPASWIPHLFSGLLHFGEGQLAAASTG